MNSREFKDLAKQSLDNNWGIAIGVSVLFTIIVSASGNAGIIGVLFLGYPLYYGYAKFNMALRVNEHNFDHLFDGFRENYFDNAITILIYEFFTLLWALLLIVPGIIKALSYSMTKYILVDGDYNLTHTDAIRKSEQMMYGNKGRLFKLHLSFLLWHLLGILTLGILNMVYVIPWQEQTVCHFYYELKENDMEDERYQEKLNPPIKEIEEDNDDWDF